MCGRQSPGYCGWTEEWWKDVVEPNAYSLNSKIIFVKLELERLYIMANSGKSKAAKEKELRDEIAWKGFRNINLSENDKLAVKALSLDYHEVFEALLEIVQAGHKITISQRADKNAIALAITGQSATCPNKGYTLSSFASDIPTAINVAIYKHFTLAQGVWSEDQTGNDDDIG